MCAFVRLRRERLKGRWDWLPAEERRSRALKGGGPHEPDVGMGGCARHFEACLDEVVRRVQPLRDARDEVVPEARSRVAWVVSLHPAGGQRQRDGEVCEPEQVHLGERLDGEGRL